MDNQSSTVTIHPRTPGASAGTAVPDALPPVLQTPAGLALLELQGTINLPEAPRGDEDEEGQGGQEHSVAGPHAQTVPIGRLDFPDYDPSAGADSTGWMRRVHLYVGPHQRLTGEVKKLPRPLAVVRRKQQQKDSADRAALNETDLEVVEVVYYKLLFSQRPEPMTATSF
ncbi:hypothetical protein SPBR_08733 [Sporothrix brasiliensis 5110]|uniref:Chromosome transmission fidelity protein 8 n=1 Tax=Sporothrix brasiliensis 5110 TaxID=1398154 RepID=A0A0C2IAP6_9PEZI|nr:uncharacterized protein SPBR_08733 [Sporothrix brasiliensis 5110]KIH86306.1 hypothetical protein SPBR_08733 [Sporothrix brasiliensis 5110]